MRLLSARRTRSSKGDGFEVFIIDWMIPDLNGLEVVRRIRRLIGNTPIIILTAYDWADIEVEAKAAGVTAFCAKPLFVSELRRILAEPFLPEEAAEQTEKRRISPENGCWSSRITPSTAKSR